MVMELSLEQWIVILVGAYMVGLGKGGVPGTGNIAVAVFALALPARDSVGIILLVLIAADIVAVLIYRRHADWGYLWRLFPPAILGIILGYFALDYMGHREIRWFIGVVLFLGIGHTLWKWWAARRGVGQEVPSRNWAWPIGASAGFTTMIGNAAGPIMQLYLLAMRLPKLVFIGTGAWYFLLMNVFKVPFAAGQNMVTWENAAVSLKLIPLAVLGGICAPWIVRRLSQRWFERLVVFFIFIAALMLFLPIGVRG